MGTSTLSKTEADRLNQEISAAWNSKDSSAVLSLLSPNAEWLENETLHRGRNEIRAALKSQWEHTLHFQVQQHLTSFEGNRITARYESEWQDSLHGQWYRRSGQAAFLFDTDRLVTKIESHTEQEPISADARRLRLGMTASRA